MFSAEILQKSEQVIHLFNKEGIKIVTAESCTGGLISGALTAIAGSSNVVEGGYVTYSNEKKMADLGVRPTTLENHGAVSLQTAAEMAMGALERVKKYHNEAAKIISLSVTGIAGPAGGSKEKPVGLVYIGFAFNWDSDQTKTQEFNFTGDRNSIREQTILAVLDLLAKVRI